MFGANASFGCELSFQPGALDASGLQDLFKAPSFLRDVGLGLHLTLEGLPGIPELSFLGRATFTSFALEASTEIRLNDEYYVEASFSLEMALPRLSTIVGLAETEAGEALLLAFYTVVSFPALGHLAARGEVRTAIGSLVPSFSFSLSASVNVGFLGFCLVGSIGLDSDTPVFSLNAEMEIGIVGKFAFNGLLSKSGFRLEGSYMKRQGSLTEAVSEGIIRKLANWKPMGVQSALST
jgi:hypothetical protein